MQTVNHHSGPQTGKSIPRNSFPMRTTETQHPSSIPRTAGSWDIDFDPPPHPPTMVRPKGQENIAGPEKKNGEITALRFRIRDILFKMLPLVSSILALTLCLQRRLVPWAGAKELSNSCH